MSYMELMPALNQACRLVRPQLQNMTKTCVTIGSERLRGSQRVRHVKNIYQHDPNFSKGNLLKETLLA